MIGKKAIITANVVSNPLHGIGQTNIKSSQVTITTKTVPKSGCIKINAAGKNTKIQQ